MKTHFSTAIQPLSQFRRFVHFVQPAACSGPVLGLGLVLTAATTTITTDSAALFNLSKDGRLPLSKKAVASIAAANSWEQDRIAQAIASGRRGWIAAGAGVVLALLGFSMATFQSLRLPPAPYPVVVDRTTGETSVVATLDASNAPASPTTSSCSRATTTRWPA